MGTSDLSLRERLARPLRGEYNSVLYRFMILPWEWFRFGLHRLGGGSWVSFYAIRLDVGRPDALEVVEREHGDTGRSAQTSGRRKAK